MIMIEKDKVIQKNKICNIIINFRTDITIIPIY